MTRLPRAVTSNDICPVHCGGVLVRRPGRIGRHCGYCGVEERRIEVAARVDGQFGWVERADLLRGRL